MLLPIWCTGRGAAGPLWRIRGVFNAVLAYELIAQALPQNPRLRKNRLGSPQSSIQDHSSKKGLDWNAHMT